LIGCEGWRRDRGGLSARGGGEGEAQSYPGASLSRCWQEGLFHGSRTL
jgi:hypothetical protein